MLCFIMPYMQEKVLSKREKNAFAFSAVTSYMIVSFASTYLNAFYTEILLVPPIFLFVLMTVARVWDAVNDPMMGLIVERTRHRLGRMRPYLRNGALAMAISLAVLFLPIQGPVWLKCIYATITYFAFGMLYTLTDIPLWGLMAATTHHAEERAELLANSATIGSIGALLPMAFIPALVFILKTDAMAFMVFSFVIAGWCYWSMRHISYVGRERVLAPKERIPFADNFKIALKNRPMMMTILGSIVACTRYLMQISAIYITIYVIHIGDIPATTLLLILYGIVGIGMVLGMLLTPVLYKKYGYKKAFLIGSVVGFASLLVAYFVPPDGNLLYVVFGLMILGGFSLGNFNVITYPMVGDSLDYLEWKTGSDEKPGERIEGFCFSLQSFMTKFNQAFAAIALTLVLILVNYKQPIVPSEPLPQEPETTKGLYSMVTLLPAIGFGLSAIPMYFYNFSGKKRQRILAELDARRTKWAERHADKVAEQAVQLAAADVDE